MRSSWVALPLEESEGFGSIGDGFECQNASYAIRMLMKRPILRLCMQEEMMKRTKASDGVEGRRISALTPNSRCCCAELFSEIEIGSVDLCWRKTISTAQRENRKGGGFWLSYSNTTETNTSQHPFHLSYLLVLPVSISGPILIRSPSYRHHNVS